MTNKIVLANLTANKYASILAAIGLAHVYEEQSDSKVEVSWTDDVPSGIHTAVLHGSDVSQTQLGDVLSAFVHRSNVIEAICLSIEQLSKLHGTPIDDWYDSKTKEEKSDSKKRSRATHKKNMTREKWTTACEIIKRQFGSPAEHLYEGIWSDAVKSQSKSDAISVSPLNVSYARVATIENQFHGGLMEHLLAMTRQQLADELTQQFATPVHRVRSLRYDDSIDNGIAIRRNPDKTDEPPAPNFPTINLLALIGDGCLVNYPGPDGNTCPGYSDNCFTYPIWNDPRTLREIVCLLRREIPRTQQARASLGIVAVYRARRFTRNKTSYFSMAERIG